MYQDERKLDFKPLGMAIEEIMKRKGWTQEYLVQLIARAQQGDKIRADEGDILCLHPGWARQFKRLGPARCGNGVFEVVRGHDGRFAFVIFKARAAPGTTPFVTHPDVAGLTKPVNANVG